MQTKKLNILRVMGCESLHYGSMERYLVCLTKKCTQRGHCLHIVYENVPISGEFIREIYESGGNLIELKMRNKLDVFFLFKLRKIIINHNIDIVHSYFPFTWQYASVVACLMWRKVLRTAGNMPLTSKLPEKITKTFKLKTSMRQRLFAIPLIKLICISDAVKNEYISLGIDPKKIETIKAGVDLDVYNPNKIKKLDFKKEFNIDKNKEFIIGTVGRLVHQKNIEFLIEVFKNINSKITNTKLIIVGEGPLRGKLLKKCEQLDLENKVILTGKRNDVPSIMDAFNIFVFPSLFEGMGNALLEAMALKKPVVVSDIDVFTEVINDGKNGFICSLSKPYDFVNTIMKLLMDPDLSKRIGNEAQLTISKKFDVNERVRKTINLYEKL